MIPPSTARSLGKNSRTATFTPDDWLAQTEYTLSFTTVLTDASGDTLALPPATPFVPPFLLEHSPGNNAANVSPATPLVFYFDRPIDPTSVQAAITITPTVTGAFTLEGNSLIFVPSEGYLHPSTTYRGKLATTGPVLPKANLCYLPPSFSFTTGELKSEVNFRLGNPCRW
ncbi:MAG: Ig-like domain-containing protein [Chloroflexi bacterium]|nr:Ig-like domain-containing protein [Chloroflexota bacterium]